jgi:SEC-C motif
MEPSVESEPEQDVDDRLDGAIRREIRQLLDLLPEDVVSELNAGSIDVRDPAFLAGLTDHISRQALADPKSGNHLLGKLAKVKTLIRRTLRETDENVVTSSTIRRSARHVGRNDPCPCGSGRKFKECCLGK